LVLADGVRAGFDRDRSSIHRLPANQDQSPVVRETRETPGDGNPWIVITDQNYFGFWSNASFCQGKKTISCSVILPNLYYTLENVVPRRHSDGKS
jgi:hypothetical protein